VTISGRIYSQPNKTRDVPLTVTVLLAIYDGNVNKLNKGICEARKENIKVSQLFDSGYAGLQYLD
jgi:hypothetical protein